VVVQSGPMTDQQPPPDPYGQQPPPYAASYLPPGYGLPPGPKKRRPSAWWFALGGGLLVAAIAVGVGLVVWALSDYFDVDATVEGDGQTHAVTLSGQEERMVWQHPAEPVECQIVDAATGTGVETRPVTETYTRSGGSGEWEGIRLFDPGSGDLEVTCSEQGGPIQIGVAPDLGRIGGGVLAGVLGSVVLGGLGLIVLVVTGILFATRGPRRPTT
jgi:hypothetical protein